MPSSPRRRHRRPRLKLVLIGLAVFFVVGAIIAAFTARPAWRWIKGQKAERLSAEALTILEESPDESQLAGEKLREAWDLAPGNPEVKRAWAQVMARNSRELTTAKMLYEQLNESGHATPEDQIDRATVYARLGDASEARQILEALPPDLRNSRAGLELEARLSLAEGDVTTANQTYMEALRSTAESDPRSRLELASMEAADPFGEVSKKAREELFVLATEPDQVGLAALERLASMKRPNRSELRRVIELLRDHPLATKRHHFLTRSLELKLDPDRRNEILEDELTAQADLPLSQSHEFLGWLLQIGEPGLLLQLLDLDAVRQDPRLTGVYLQALVDREQWRRLDSILNDSTPLPITKSMRHLLRAMVLHEMGGSDSEVKESIRASFREASDDKNYRDLFAAASFCEESELHQLASEGYELIASHAQTREAGLEGLYRVAADREAIDEMIEVTDRILDRAPQHERHRENRSYLRLLSGFEMELAMEDVRQLVDINDRDDERQFLLAFAHFRMGNSSRTREILTRIDVERLAPGYRAVAAWLLSSVGEESDAFHLARRIDERLLMDREASFIARVR